jgi:hypothetical protein
MAQRTQHLIDSLTNEKNQKMESAEKLEHLMERLQVFLLPLRVMVVFMIVLNPHNRVG